MLNREYYPEYINKGIDLLQSNWESQMMCKLKLLELDFSDERLYVESMLNKLRKQEEEMLQIIYDSKDLGND